jgi:hypothetical protein
MPAGLNQKFARPLGGRRSAEFSCDKLVRLALSALVTGPDGTDRETTLVLMRQIQVCFRLRRLRL